MIESWQPAYPSYSGALFCTPAIDVPIGIRHFCVTDVRRASGENPYRRFQVSVFYPAEPSDLPQARLVDILEPRTQEALALLSADCETEWKQNAYRRGAPRLLLKAQRDTPLKASPSKRSLLIYYPGGEATRFSNVAMCEALAALGYVIVTLDAPRDAPVVVFPDGEMATPPMEDDESYIWPRVADVRCLIDELTEPTFIDSLADVIDPSHIGMFGHSRGGYLSNICAVEDSRIRAAANLDGFLWGFWTEGTGLDCFPPNFQRRARSLTTPILRIIAEQANNADTQRRFDSEKNDFGGPFTLMSLNRFDHSAFETSPFLSLCPDKAVAAIKSLEMNETSPFTHHASQTLVPILDAFFSAAFAANNSGENVAWPDRDGAFFFSIVP